MIEVNSIVGVGVEFLKLAHMKKVCGSMLPLKDLEAINRVLNAHGVVVAKVDSVCTVHWDEGHELYDEDSKQHLVSTMHTDYLREVS